MIVKIELINIALSNCSQQNFETSSVDFDQLFYSFKTTTKIRKRKAIDQLVKNSEEENSFAVPTSNLRQLCHKQRFNSEQVITIILNIIK